MQDDITKYCLFFERFNKEGRINIKDAMKEVGGMTKSKMCPYTNKPNIPGKYLVSW